MNHAQIKHMVDRFLGWPLPQNFHPDGGITYKPGDYPGPGPYYRRSGTNLLDATQALEMVCYMLEGMPKPVIGPESVEEKYAVVEVFGHRRLVGRVSEVERYGSKMLRIDIPTDGDFDKGFITQFYGGASIFCETPTTLEMVRQEHRPYAPPGLLSYRQTDAGDDGVNRGIGADAEAE